jgi:CRP/FNR family transcriptional regulator, anaerobic regulatory protein
MLSPAHYNNNDLPPNHPCGGCPVRDFAVCGVLGTDDLKSFRRLGCHIALRSGQCLFNQGDPALSVFTVTAGMLKSYRSLPDGRRQITGFHLPGDFIGSSIDDDHAFTAEAIGECRVCAFPVRRFDHFVEDHPPMERELYIAAARELAGAQKQMVLLGRKTAIERIASFFLTLADRARTDVIDLPMCRADIADYLGLTKETVSRVLAELKSMRAIRLEAIDRIQILDRPRMKQIAAGAEWVRKAA